MPNAKRALVLGLDAIVPNMVEKFLAEGVLPNFAKLVERGALTRIRSVIPPQTPTNWNTIATGATPGTHGVALWGSHVPGEPVWEFHSEEAFNAALCQAEYLWETAARSGRRSVVMNYAGYPPTTDKAVFIEWLFQVTGQRETGDADTWDARFFKAGLEIRAIQVEMKRSRVSLLVAEPVTPRDRD